MLFNLGTTGQLPERDYILAINTVITPEKKQQRALIKQVAIFFQTIHVVVM